MAQWSKLTDAYIPQQTTNHEVVMIADQDGNIINTFGAASNVIISAGLLPGYSSIHKFGAVPAMAQNGSGTVWDVDDTDYPWGAFEIAGPLSISTTTSNGTLSSLDDGLDVVIIGLDENYEEVSETITISGNSGLGTTNFKRVYRAYVTDGALTNQTQIRVSTTVTSPLTGTTSEVLRINIGKAQTLMAIYTVPAGKTAYLMQGTTTVAANADATVDMFIRYFGQSSFRIGHSLEVAGVGGQYFYPFPVPIRIPEKSDIDVRAEVRTNKARVTAAFDIILVDNA